MAGPFSFGHFQKKKYGPIRATPPTGNPETRPWRPWSLHWPFLLTFVALCIALCIGIELVLRGCSVGGCRDFNKRDTDRDVNESRYDLTYFIYNQFPTILSLILNMLWATSHHDVMRLEPYFRMSAPGGSSAADSIFLEYPYTFALFIPFVAGKRRHYTVMLSSCIALSLGFLVTPLISGLFDEKRIPVQNHALATRLALRPVDENSTCSGDFTYSAYQITWLNGSFPTFTTPEYTVLPVVYNGGQETGELWKANTTLFEAELTCKSAGTINISPTKDHGIRVNITSQDGAYSVILCDQINKSAKLLNNISMANAAHATSSLVGLGTSPPPVGRSDGAIRCDGFTTFITPWTAIAQRVLYGPSPGNGSEVYLFGWASGVSSPGPFKDSAPRPTNITALFCTTSYYSQPVTMVLGSGSGNITNITRLDVRERFVNRPNFDNIINGEIDAVSTPTNAKNSAGDLFGLGYLPGQWPNVDTKLQGVLGIRPENMTRLFAGAEEGDIDSSSHSTAYIDNVNGLPGIVFSDRTSENLWELLDPEILAASYQKALRLLFGLMVSVELVDVDQGEIVPVITIISAIRYDVNRLWARGSQGGLVAVAVVVALMMVLTVKRQCNLDGEPNSLAEALRLLACSPELVAEMENSEFHDPKELMKVFENGGGLYELKLEPEEGPRVIVKTLEVREHTRLVLPDFEKRKPWTEQLWQLKGIFGGGFLAIFGVVGILLSVVFGYHSGKNGLSTLAPFDSFGYGFIYSYLPLALGMAPSPIMISIASCVCMLGPYTMLARRAGSSPLTLDFDKSPPQFQFVRSLRTGHFPLFALDVAILLCNVLAVSLAGLFFTSTSYLDDRPFGVATYPAPILLGGFTDPGYDMYLLFAEMRADTAPPLQWINPEYYIIPYRNVDPAISASYPDVDAILTASYYIITIGIGLEVKCRIVPAQNITFHCKNFGCEISQQFRASDYSLIIDDQCWDYPGGNYSWQGLSHDNIIPSSNCNNTFFPIWVERPWNPDPKNNNLYKDHLDALIMTCSTVETVVMTEVYSTDDYWSDLTTLLTFNEDEVEALYASGASRLATTFNEIVVNGIRAENTRDNHKIRWLNRLMKTIEPQIVRKVTNMTHLPNTTLIEDIFQKTYTELFAINLQQAAHTIIDFRQPETTQVSASIRRLRVVMSGEMFRIAISMIGVIMLLLFFVYLSRQQPVGYLPHHLAGMYALLYASNAKEECGKLQGRNPAERAKNLEDLGGTYACGAFAGGKHYGVYRTGKLTKSGTSGTEGELELLEM